MIFLVVVSFAFLLALPLPAVSQFSGHLFAERYWDCCKPDCSWKAKADFNQPVKTCDKNNNPQSDFTLGSSCGGGTAYACANQSPWAVNDTFAYGFAGVFIMEHASNAWCCACYELTFTDDSLKGKKMIVQANNGAFDVTDRNRFILAIPGGNTSYANACAQKYDVSSSVFGVEKEGVHNRTDCNNIPDAMQDGCRWRFDWLENVRRPQLDYKRVTCPSELTDLTGCIRNDDTTFESAASSKTASRTVYTILITGMSIGMASASFLW